MHKILIAVLFISFTHLGFSQTTEKRTEGIYKSLREFIQNKPSMELNKSVIEKKNFNYGSSIDEVVIGRKLNVKHKTCNKIGDIFGFSDGNKSYKMLGKHFTPYSIFTEIHFCEGLLVYESVGHPYYSSPLVSVTWQVSFYIEVIDPKTSERYNFYKHNIKKLLKTTPDLFKKYKRETFKNETLLSYFKRFIKLSPKAHWKLAQEKGFYIDKVE